MWMYWDTNDQLTQEVIDKHNVTDHRNNQYSNVVAYCLLNNAIYPMAESTICHFPKVTSLTTINEIRLMYSLGLTEKDM